MNSPENRYDIDGWFCQNPTMLRSRSGRRRNGLSSGVRRADHHVIAAAGAGMPSIQHEFLRAQPRLPRERVELGRVRHQFVPGSRRLDVDFDHAGSGVTLNTAMRGSYGGV